MISKYLSSIEGISLYPIISLLLFFAIFIGVIIWVIKLDKAYVAIMEKLPLDGNNKNENNSEIGNEIKV